MNTIFIKECGIVRKASLALGKSQPVKPLPVLTQEFCVKWFDFYQEIIVVCSASDALSFMSGYHALIARMRAWNQAIASKFEQELDANLSSFGINKKNMEKLKKTLKTKWRSVLRDAREAREEKKRELADAKYLLLKKPVNLAKWENEKLDTFLKDNAWARTY